MVAQGKVGGRPYVSLRWLGFLAVCKGEMAVFQLRKSDLLGTKEFQGLPFNPEVANVSIGRGWGL